MEIDEMITERIEKARQWAKVLCLALSAGIFWGAVAAAVVRYALDIDGGQALLFVCLPIAVLFTVYMVPKLRKILGFE